uniref:Uncharacterized protein n=1 Tax=Panagrolaimus sp. ES5 TaxID=591445 RepID=A0AC34GPY4_9BILA
METMMIAIIINGIWIFGFLLSSWTIFIQCSFRRKKKEPPPSSLLNPPSPHTILQQRNSTSIPTTTPLSSGGGAFQNAKNPLEFAEMTQSTQSIRGSPENDHSKPPAKHTAAVATNKNKSKASKISNKKNRSKMKKVEKHEPSIIKTAHLPAAGAKKDGSKLKSVQMVVERTQEDSYISPSLRAVQEWEKKMRQDFPEISERTQPLESSVKRIELTETLFSDQLHSPSNFSSHDNLLHEDNHQGHEDNMTMSLSTHSTINAKTNIDKTTTKSSRYIPAQHQEVSTPPLTTKSTATGIGGRKKTDEDDCNTARLPELKVTRT